MATQYEVEHGIRPDANRNTRRRVDMSSFDALLDQISTTGQGTSTNPIFSNSPHNNQHATPTLVDVASLYRLVQEQMETLASTAPSEDNRRVLERLIEDLAQNIEDPPDEVSGVPQDFLDRLERVPRKKLRKDDSCLICAETYLDDPYCLVVQLPCHRSHRFDLECVGPWLQSKGSCPMCRKDFTKKKEVVVDSEEEEEDPAGMFA